MREPRDRTSGVKTPNLSDRLASPELFASVKEEGRGTRNGYQASKGSKGIHIYRPRIEALNFESLKSSNQGSKGL